MSDKVNTFGWKLFRGKIMLDKPDDYVIENDLTVEADYSFVRANIVNDLSDITLMLYEGDKPPIDILVSKDHASIASEILMLISCSACLEVLSKVSASSEYEFMLFLALNPSLKSAVSGLKEQLMKEVITLPSGLSFYKD